MTDLIKRLLANNGESFVETVCGEAADLLKELHERLTAATDDAKEAEAYAEELDARNKELTLQLLATSGQAADALDKLTKAMAGLRKIADHKHFSWDQGWIQNTEARIASAVLAELEGK